MSVATSISGKKQVGSRVETEGKEQLGSYKVDLDTCRIAFLVQTVEQSSRAASYDPKTVRVGHGQAHGPNINNYFDFAVVLQQFMMPNSATASCACAWPLGPVYTLLNSKF